jgi:predicted RNA-binding Zn-ribbon protein involved in translation (DUF1610 family)
MNNSQLTKEVIWDEPDLIEQKKNCLNNNAIEPNVIMSVIKNDLIKNQCNDIGNKKWKKNCPKCGKEQMYSSKYTLKNAIFENKFCNKCRGQERKIKIPTDVWIKFCPSCGEKQIYSCKSVLTLSLKKNTICNQCQASLKKTRPTADKWKRKCSNCGIEITYKSAKSYLFCVRHDTKCRKCATKESSKYKDKSYFQSNEYRQKMSRSVKNGWKKKDLKSKEVFKRKCSENAYKQWENNRNKMIKIMHSNEYRYKHHVNSKNMWKNPSHIEHMKKVNSSDEYRKQRRIIAQNILRQRFGNGHLSGYNKNACEFIDKLNKERGWNLQHALNGGEYSIDGYSLDGYDKEKNIAFEYDEPRHYNIDDNLKSGDVYRQKNIINSLHPSEFWRYNERKNNMYNVLIKENLCHKV